MTGSETDEVKYISGTKVGTSLQPEGNGSCHYGGGHGGAGIAVPGIGTAMVSKALHIRISVGDIGIGLEIETIVGGDDIAPRRHHIGLDTAIDGGAHR